MPYTHFNTPRLRGGKPYIFPKIPLLPQLSLSLEYTGSIPDSATCYDLLEKYKTFPHIVEHSETVTSMALALATKVMEQYPKLATESFLSLTLASALLHDIAKSYTVQYGGSHAQIGASWVIAETKNHRIGQAVYHHVEWPWELPKGQDLLHPLFLVLYADKRTKHNEIATLNERYEDLLVRYGKSKHSITAIERGHEHALEIETRFGQLLEVDLNEYIVAGGRLVRRS